MIEFIERAIEESRHDLLAEAYREMTFWRRFKARTDSGVEKQWCDYFFKIARDNADETMTEIENARTEKESCRIQRTRQDSDSGRNDGEICESA